jgi:DNA-binding GntR family transcriptional regulator
MCKYKNIVDYLLEKIASGEIKVEQNMPTIRNLSEQFQCSKVTVVRAYTELMQRHIVYAAPQSGYFLVNKNRSEMTLNSAIINFAAVSPDETILPYEEFQHCLNQAIAKYEQTLFLLFQSQRIADFHCYVRKAFARVSSLCEATQYIYYSWLSTSTSYSM